MEENKKRHFLFYIFQFDRNQCKIENKNMLNQKIREFIQKLQKGE
jgi:hypothetical protein